MEKLKFTFRSFGISPYFTIQNMLGHPVWIPRMQSFFVTIAKILLGNYSDGSWNIGNNWNVLIHQFLALVCQAWGFWESLLSNIKGRMSDKTCSFYLHSCRTPQVCDERCTLPAAAAERSHSWNFHSVRVDRLIEIQLIFTFDYALMKIQIVTLFFQLKSFN